MASICLYDVDFLHGSKFVPNLELMKVFNYYNKKGDIVNLAKKGENLGRYNQIIFFKNRSNTIFPKNISLHGDNIQIYGYGFYNRFIPLNDKFTNVPPSYLIYDIVQENIKNINLYNQIKKGSLIRVENNDFTDFKSEQKNIFVADNDFVYLPAAQDFIQKYKRDYNIKFLHSPIARDEETFLKFFSIIAASNKRFFIDYKMTTKTFLKYHYEKVIFSPEKFQDEHNPSIYLQRITKMILLAKYNNKPLLFGNKSFTKIEKQKYILLNLFSPLMEWNKSLEPISFFEFAEKQGMDMDKLNNLLANKRKLRLLLKQSPTTLNIQSFDLYD